MGELIAPLGQHYAEVAVVENASPEALESWMTRVRRPGL